MNTEQNKTQTNQINVINTQLNRLKERLETAIKNCNPPTPPSSKPPTPPSGKPPTWNRGRGPSKKGGYQYKHNISKTKRNLPINTFGILKSRVRSKTATRKKSITRKKKQRLSFKQKSIRRRNKTKKSKHKKKSK